VTGLPTVPVPPSDVILTALVAAGVAHAEDVALVGPVLDALNAAGLAVVPVAETHTEWGARRIARYGSTVAGPMWKAEAEDFARLAKDPRTGELATECVVRRTVYVGPWEPVPDEDDGGG
jgi:hypothetical protein